MPTQAVNIYAAADYPAEIRRAAQSLRDGKLIVLPTETVYGVAAVASNPDAVRAAKALRGGDATKPLTIHLAQPQDIDGYLPNLSAHAKRMVNKLWPGPVAISFPVDEAARKTIAQKFEVRDADIFEADRLTLRCPKHKVASDVLADVGQPVVLSVAGGDGQSARQVEQFAARLEGKVELIIDAGPTIFAKPSTILEVTDTGYRIVREGIYDQRMIERMMRTTFLFVCSGNTCRSPMAEAIARKLLADRLGIKQDQLESKGFAVLSAGASAFPGSKATPEAADAVAAMGADLSKHRSRLLMPELINQADHIFTMTQNHRQAVIAHVPAAAAKTTPLDPTKDVEDPIGGDGSLYRELADDLAKLISQRLDQVL